MRAHAAMAALIVCVSGASSVCAEDAYPYAAYEPLLDCYVGFMNSHGVTLASKESEVRRLSTAAKTHCSSQYASLVEQAGAAKAGQAWRGLWSENASRN